MNTLSSIAYRDGFTIDVTATIAEAMACMLANQNGSAVLLDDGIPVSIVTESKILSVLEDDMDLSLPVSPLAQSPVIVAYQNRPIESAFDMVVTHNIRRLVLIDRDKSYRGVVLQEDLFRFFEEDVYKVDLTVANLLTQETNIISLDKERDLYTALILMRHSHIGSVIVTDNSGQAVGIVTEKDILTAGYHKISLKEPLSSLMSSPVLSVSIEDTITKVITLMLEQKVRRVLVRQIDGSMCALLTNRDIFKHIKGNVSRMLEIKLRHAKEIMDLLPEPIIEIFDAKDSQVVHWINKRAREEFGDEVLEQSPQIFFGSSWDRIYTILTQVGRIEHFQILLNGRNFDFSGTLSKNINSNYIKLIAKDVTSHENMKQQLKEEVKEETRLRQEQEYLMMQQSRLASMGEMIGHIAHQWRQPLAQLGGILMNLESAQVFGELNESYLQEKIDHGNKLIKYMSQTIDDFRLFFMPCDNCEYFDVVDALRQAVSIVSAGLDYHHIEVKMDMQRGSFFAKESAREFTQMILNLLNNSKDALSKSKNEERIITITLSQEDGMITLVFCDNAGGIDPEVLPNIFELYVSTKNQTEGSGIGLYMTQLIIEQKMKGSISVKNGTEGACFTLSFPSI